MVKVKIIFVKEFAKCDYILNALACQPSIPGIIFTLNSFFLCFHCSLVGYSSEIQDLHSKLDILAKELNNLKAHIPVVSDSHHIQAW